MLEHGRIAIPVLILTMLKHGAIATMFEHRLESPALLVTTRAYHSLRNERTLRVSLANPSVCTSPPRVKTTACSETRLLLELNQSNLLR